MSQENALSNEIQSKSSAGRPFGLWVVIVLSALMVYRVTTLMWIPLLGDTIPEFWIVAFTGDAFVGITALIVAALLWRSRGLAVWTIAIIWQVIGLKDYTVGMQLQFIEPFDPSMSNTMAMIFFGGGIAVHLVCIYLLVRYRNYYLG